MTPLKTYNQNPILKKKTNVVTPGNTKRFSMTDFEILPKFTSMRHKN